jgi:histidyl-tRNA synthetase
MRDLLPRAMLRRERVIDTIKDVYRSYGFEPLETPACERLDVLLGKYGEEGDQLVFKILHRGEKLERALAGGAAGERDLGDMGLRYDLTVPLARVVAGYQNDLPRYFKRYQIQPVWRAERPQHGRFREFYQCDVDVVGASSRVVEAEVLGAAAQCLTRLGFKDFKLRINHRGLLRAIVEHSGIANELEGAAIVAVDKLDKIGRDGVAAELATRGVSAEASGQADLALRYDLTVPLARVVADNRGKLPKFFKRYQIQPVWRADRPQRGRFREFYQCDVDAIGSTSPVVEAEMIAAVSEVLQALGFTDFTVQLNHRALLTGVLNLAGIESAKHSDALVAIDKLDKIGADGVVADLLGRGVPEDAAREFLAKSL